MKTFQVQLSPLSPTSHTYNHLQQSRPRHVAQVYVILAHIHDKTHQRIFQEITGCVYQNTKDFHNKYFLKNDLDQYQ